MNNNIINDIIFPQIFDGLPVTAFFTGKNTNTDFNRLNLISTNKQIYLPIQKHTNKIIIIDAPDSPPQEGDGVITQLSNILIGVRTADCVPILLYCRDAKDHAPVIAAVHAGWRGTALSILKNTISAFKSDFHCDPKEIMIAIGPSIKYCCYKVGQEVIDAVYEATGTGDYYKHEHGNLFIDLVEANRKQALSQGIDYKNIWSSQDCTYCNPDTYFSYRQNPQINGRQGGFISISSRAAPI